MMKKALALLLLIAALLALCGLALADQEAANITEGCGFKVSSSKKKYTNMTDGQFTTKWESNKAKTPNVEVTAPKGQKIYGMYLCMATMPDSWELQTRVNGAWVKYADGGTEFYHQYIAIPEGTEELRIICTMTKHFQWGINEIYLLGEGEVPSWVQRWEPVAEKLDLLVFAAHPDDESLFFGAIIAQAIDQGIDVGVATYSYSNTTRRSELLNGLWAMGLRHYPIIGKFSDHYDKDMTAAYKYQGGKAKVQTWVTEVIRRCKPDVVVTHGEQGEYGHKQHQMVSDAVKAAVEMAASETSCYESIPVYGTWQVKKLYLHEYTGGTTVTVDWSKPLASYGGLTGTQVSMTAYAYHITQRAAGFILMDEAVSYKGKTYDHSTFGLYMSQVGDDVACDSLMEHLRGEGGLVLTPVTEPQPEPEPEWAARFPALNAKGFLDEGEFVEADDTNGLYLYVNQTVKIVIQRKNDPAQNLTWFEADVWCDTDAGEYMKTLFYDDEKKGKKRVDASKNALKHQAVFAMNTDYYTYRVGGPRRTGIVIRNGEILYDDGYDKPTDLFPNLDTVAFYPDGTLSVAHSYEHKAQWYIDQGAVNVYAFGPYLIRDGVMNPDLYAGSNLKYKNPRWALGMVEPGHYVAVLCEGRLKRSGGVTMNELALMMKRKGCTQAINLDGGQTAVMIFMGKQLNLIGKYDGKTSARETCDIMTIGTSELVGNVEFK